MLISINWIKSFVNIPQLSPKEIAEKFTLTTAEVEDFKTTGAGLDQVKIAQIISIRPHPEADKLNLVTFKFQAGSDESKEVVCGAPNVRVGLKIPYAPLGTTLPNGMTLEPKKIRGILSEGMLCSEVELGLGEGKSGLMELPEDAPLGQSILEYLKLSSDLILEVDNKSLTHRPDLWGHYGLAREFAAQFQQPLKNIFDQDWQTLVEKKFNKMKSPVEFKVDPESSCLSYLGLSLKGVKVKESPDWIKNRLTDLGMRSINSVVDISNLVMLELGIPNHIFDRNKIKGDLHIAPLLAPENFETLDGVSRALIIGDTIIRDTEKTLVLAGIMGGSSAGVTFDTQDLFIEVANWEASVTRKTSVRLGLRTDSSQRYEKSLDSQLCYRTLLRLVDILLQIHPEATVEGMPQIYHKAQSPQLRLSISAKKIQTQLGHDLSEDEIKKIFQSLDFKVAHENGIFKLEIPSYRTTKDISCEADLIEEIGRMIGYDNIKPFSPLLPVRPVRLSATKIFHRKIQDFFTLQAQSLEVMTYPLVGESLLEKSLWPTTHEKLKLLNALSVDADRMRPSLIPSALQVVADNYKNYSSFSFFEIGRIYPDFENEKNHLVFVHFSKETSPYLKLINTAEKFFNYIQIPFEFLAKDKTDNPLIPSLWEGWHPHESMQIKMMGKLNGSLLSIHPILLKNYKVKGHVSMLVLDLSTLENRQTKEKLKYSAISKFPLSSFDCSVEVSKDLPGATPLKILQKNFKSPFLKSSTIVSVFSLNERMNSVTLRCVFGSDGQTLGSETIKSLENEIVAMLSHNGFSLKN